MLVLAPQSERLKEFLMPIRWYGNGDPKDPIYLHFSRIVSFTVHAMAFAAVNSGLWFFQQIRHPWLHLDLFTGLWLIGVFAHLVFVVVKRPGSNSNPTPIQSD